MSLVRPLVRPLVSPLVGPLVGFGAAVWTPADLFSTEEGAWYDPSDLTKMWQDDGGTTPAAVDSPVGLIHDKSGNGNHASQGTAASRPTLRQSGSVYYLEFDGIDDFLTTATMDFTGTAAMSVIHGSEKTQDANIARFMDTPAASSNAAFYFAAPSAASITRNILQVLTGGGNQSVTDVSAAEDTKRVWTQELDLDAPLVSLRKDGSSVGTNTNAMSGVFSNSATHIGQRSNGSQRFQGNAYQIVMIGRALTTDERSTTESYVADKAGITL